MGVGWKKDVIGDERGGGVRRDEKIFSFLH